MYKPAVCVWLLLTLPVLAAPLTGEWAWHDSQMSITLDLLPDGRYDWDMKTQGIDFPEKGSYRLDGDSLTLARDGAHPVTYQIQPDGSAMTMSGGVFPVPRRFTLTGNSVEALQQQEAAQQSVAASQQAAEDARWQQRIPLALVNPAWHIGPVGEVPADPNPGHHVAGATVFKTVQGYTNTYLIGRPGTTHQSMNQMRWYFMPNGRGYANWTLQKLAGPPMAGTTLGTWGAYSIDSDGTLHVETDRGEKLTMRLEHGRRTLVYGESRFTQVQAANDELDRMINQLK